MPPWRARRAQRAHGSELSHALLLGLALVLAAGRLPSIALPPSLWLILRTAQYEFLPDAAARGVRARILMSNMNDQFSM